MSEIRAQVAAAVLPPGEFRVGRVLSRSFEVLFHDFFKFALIAVIAIIPYGLLTFMGGAAAFVGPQAHPNVSPAAIGAAFIGFGILFPFLYAISMAATLYGAFQDMRGRPFRLSEAFGRGLARLLPIIGLSICWVIAIGFGTLLLIVPGLMMMAAFYVALPACVMEGLGPFQSMSRSAALTKGHRWKVFGVYLVVALIAGIVGSVINLIITLSIAPMAGLISGLVWNLLTTAYNSIAIAVMYHDLRVLKDGIDIDRIAAVFD